MKQLRWLAAAAMVAMAACSGSRSYAPPAAADAGLARAKTNPIRHVVFIIQENRSFNNLFMGFPGAKTQSYGYDTGGNKIPLHEQSLAIPWDIDHSSLAFFTACDGRGKVPGRHCRMDGWNGEFHSLGSPPNFGYAYTTRSDVRPYWDLAKQYVLFDRTFASNLDGSFVAHQYEVAAFASASVNFPVSNWGCEGGKKDTILTLTAARTYGPPIQACYDNPTIGDAADDAGLSWRFYTGAIDGDGGLWSSFQADRKVFKGPEWTTNVIDPPSRFLTDVGKGKLANITWVTPTYKASDHPGLNASDGPAWVASIVNAVGASPFWKSTTIFVVWDDWGGWFDPVAPVYEDYDGLGFRVPMIAISPYAKNGYVAHEQYETSSVLRYIEDTFGLSPLAASDRRAADPAREAFDYGRRPRAFKPIAGAKPAAYWIRQDRNPQRGKPGTIIGDD